jgi:hypothetical protein
MKTIEMIDTNINGYEETRETVSYELNNSPLGLGIIMTMAGLVGIWGITCIISGLATAANVSELSRGLITAVTGI